MVNRQLRPTVDVESLLKACNPVDRLVVEEEQLRCALASVGQRIQAAASSQEELGRRRSWLERYKRSR